VTAAERAAVEAAPAVRASGPGSERRLASTVTELQRRAGNRAVLRLLDAGAPAARVLQRRRLPSRAALEEILFDGSASGRVDAADAAAHRAGIERLTNLAGHELSPGQRTRVSSRARAGLTAAQWAALPASERSLRGAAAVVQVRPRALLGDPALIGAGPRPGTRDAANLAMVVNGANRIFDRIASGAVDGHVAQVFGTGNVAAAKARYANARTRMNALHAMSPVQIVTDRSGYAEEAGVGGVTTSDQIQVEPSVIDRPRSRESIVLLIHEALHAGNSDVHDDGGYIERMDEFRRAEEAVKLTNAAHYEVVPRRILGMRFAYQGETFVPAAGSGSPPTPREEALQAASEAFRVAWACADDLHRDGWVRVQAAPAQWTTFDLGPFAGVAAGTHFADVLPFWSKVLGLTVHRRTHISPTSTDPSTQPVSLIDVAISEAVVRKLSQGMDAVPTSVAGAAALESRATPAERAAATTVAAESKLLVRLVLRQIGPITTGEERDLQVVRTLVATNEDYDELFRARPPSACAF
jgi:hypothetical protein